MRVLLIVATALHLANALAGQPGNYRAFSITSDANCAEEFICPAGTSCDRPDGSIYLTSSDLELSKDGSRLQVVGIVFPSVGLTAGDAASLSDTRLVFDIDEIHAGVSDAPVTVRIFGERSVNAAQPSAAIKDLTNRQRTTATVEWSPPASESEHELLMSPDISAIIREILQLPGWTSGNPLAIMIEYVGGQGVRWLESYRVNSAFATRSGTLGGTPALEVHGLVMPPPPPPSPFPPGVQCAATPCNGGNSGCNGNLCLGDGDCDADSDCAGGLMCGTDNCAAFRQNTDWPTSSPQWDSTDDCCYSPGGLGSPTPLTASFKTCDVQDAQSSAMTLLHTAPTIFVPNQVRDALRTQTISSAQLGYDAPIRAITLTALGSDGWCVENLLANGVPLDGATGVWLDNPVQAATDYALHEAHVTYTWRVPSPARTLELSWHTCDTSNAQTNDVNLLHLSEVHVMSSHTRNSVETTQVPGEARVLSLTNTGSDGWCVQDVKLNGESPNPSGQAAGIWLDNPPSGFYGSLGVAQSYTWTWATVTAQAPLVCEYIVGDGTGGSESRIGNFGTAGECAQAVHNQYPLANGATYSSTAGNGACYAEFGMATGNGNTAWRTCLFGGWPPSAPPVSTCHEACNGANGGCGGNLGLGDGDCDADADCASGLVCGTDNCMQFRSSAGWPTDGPGWDLTDDCCYYPGGLGSPSSCHVSCNGGNDGCNGNLGLGDGDCDADADCASGLVCGTDNCMAFRDSAGWPTDGPGWDLTDDCCYFPGGMGSPEQCHHTCDGGNDGCGLAMGIGDGDCDNDSDCAQGLLCGVDNCVQFRNHSGWPNDGPGWDLTDDCCYYPGGMGSDHHCPAVQPCEGSRRVTEALETVITGVEPGWLVGGILMSLVFGAAFGVVANRRMTAKRAKTTQGIGMMPPLSGMELRGAGLAGSDAASLSYQAPTSSTF